MPGPQAAPWDIRFAKLDISLFLHNNFTTFNLLPPFSLLPQDLPANVRFLLVCLLSPFENTLSSYHYDCAGETGPQGRGQLVGGQRSVHSQFTGG